MTNTEPTEHPPADELRRVTAYLANVASDFAFQAGVGSMETAGGWVSFLAANPESASLFYNLRSRLCPLIFGFMVALAGMEKTAKCLPLEWRARQKAWNNDQHRTNRSFEAMPVALVQSSVIHCAHQQRPLLW